MKRKRTNWNAVPWSDFKPCRVDLANYPDGHAPLDIWRNSRYQVGRWQGIDATLGRYFHLSIKTHDRSARHDFRDLQRIKNELVGPEFEAVELFPAESRLVDGANQYHLWVFERPFTFGFMDRLIVAEGGDGARQRPFDPDAAPADALTGADAQRRVEQLWPKPVIDQPIDNK
jgi:hypothetical protein